MALKHRPQNDVEPLAADLALANDRNSASTPRSSDGYRLNVERLLGNRRENERAIARRSVAEYWQMPMAWKVCSPAYPLPRFLLRIGYPDHAAGFH